MFLDWSACLAASIQSFSLIALCMLKPEVCETMDFYPFFRTNRRSFSNYPNARITAQTMELASKDATKQSRLFTTDEKPAVMKSRKVICPVIQRRRARQQAVEPAPEPLADARGAAPVVRI